MHVSEYHHFYHVSAHSIIIIIIIIKYVSIRLSYFMFLVQKVQNLVQKVLYKTDNIWHNMGLCHQYRKLIKLTKKLVGKKNIIHFFDFSQQVKYELC